MIFFIRYNLYKLNSFTYDKMFTQSLQSFLTYFQQLDSKYNSLYLDIEGSYHSDTFCPPLLQFYKGESEDEKYILQYLEPGVETENGKVYEIHNVKTCYNVSHIDVKLLQEAILEIMTNNPQFKPKEIRIHSCNILKYQNF